jgi:FixJ family two-component response regulator
MGGCLPEGAVAGVHILGHDSSANRSPMKAANQRPQGQTVFIVDDDAMVSRALARLLRSAGYEVETFSSGKAFLAREPAPATGFLLLDVSMPGMSGPELQERLLAQGSRLRVHLMSALDDAHVRERALATGARAWFNKPVDTDALLAAVAADAG